MFYFYRIRQCIDSIDDLSTVMLYDNSIVQLLPSTFPDRGSDYNPNMNEQQTQQKEEQRMDFDGDDNVVAAPNQLRMDSIYDIWKHLCRQFKKN